MTIMPIDPEPDAAFFLPVTPRGDPPAGGQDMDLPTVITCGKALVQRLLSDQDLRFRYYNISRTWHKSFADSGTLGGSFGQQWLELLGEKLEAPAPQTLTDFANVHAFVFQTLRRAVFALTGHDIDPDSVNPAAAQPQPAANPVPAAAAQPQATNVDTPRSFHFTPTDNASRNFSDLELGFAPTIP